MAWWGTGQRTEMTRRSPSRTSRSLRLSNSFLTWLRSRGRDEPRELRAAEAASRVSSRAAEAGRGDVSKEDDKVEARVFG